MSSGDPGAPGAVPLFEGAAAWRADPRRAGSEGNGSGEDVRAATAAILERVRREGDEALVDLARRFDAPDFDPSRLRVSREELEARASGAGAEARALLRRTRARIAAYHDRQREASFRMDIGDGSRLEWRSLPIAAAGVYVPGGAAVYPSTVLMDTVPAAVAGVPRIALATPPGALERSPVLAAAVLAAGVHEVYRIGGAQAIAAFAFGTASVRRVNKVVGPGNAYVAEAKRQLGQLVGTDAFAGPSEVVVLADATARADWIAADLLAQAEHGSGEERAILVTTSRELARAAVAELVRQAEGQPNAATIARALARHGAVVVVEDLNEAVEVAEEIAPEHLEVMTRDPEALADRFPSAGAVLLGDHSPVAASDYGAGPNHVLPTGGAARFASPLSVGDFLKRQSVLRYGERTLAALRGDFERFARIEGFEAHARSVAIRFEAAGSGKTSVSGVPAPSPERG
ncbi:MAG: histidinol dehydrogenase [Acidobacteriota bacterium]|nr:histidinol dehydrogenase [Acidobacteriota bacterium]